MQRTLAYALSPAPGLPLRFLLAAPWFGVLAALLLFAAGAPAFASRWSTPALGATHLITLGYLGMAMAGSMLQLIPVVTGIALPFSRAAAAVAWHGLALGALLLATAIILAWWSGQSPLANSWLTAKVAALIAYILLGSVALKYGKTRFTRGAAFLAALACFGYIVATAMTKNPLFFL